MLIRGQFPLRSRTSGGMAGLSLWDHGQRNINDDEFYKDDRDFYRRELGDKLMTYRQCVAACEFQQEAYYQNRESGSWSNLDLMEVPGFAAFVIENRFWSIHAPVADADITDYENQIHLEWSIRETREAIDMAFKSFADTVVIHPGSYSLKSRRFWPPAEEALEITNNRRVTLNASLRSLINHFLYRLEEWHQRIQQFQTTRKTLAEEIQALFAELDEAPPATAERYRLAARILELIVKNELPLDLVRYCHHPHRGLRLAVENVEPPNFIINTTGQLRKIHSLMMGLYQEGFEQASGLPDELFERFRPGMVLDVAHLLNSKVILSGSEHEEISHIFEDHEDLDRPFVSLPGEYPADEDEQSIEPLLNKFVREGCDDLLFAYIAGCRKTDRLMTTHDPVHSFRKRVYLHPRVHGKGTVARYSLRTIEPDYELNLAEVIQVLGADKVFLMKLHDLPPEEVLSSFHNISCYLDFLAGERRRARERLDGYLETLRQKPSGAEQAAAVEDRLRRARFYVRSHQATAENWRLGYDESGFYEFTNDPRMPTDIFATVKEETGAVWVDPLLGSEQEEEE